MNEKKKMGRPTQNPRTNRMELRLSDNDLKMLEFCSEKLKMSKSDIIRFGIEKIHGEATE